MAKQIVDIGIQGNDGTGDSIRESFRKVNENFTELYAIFGLEGTINFTDLSDTPSSYTSNQIIMANNAGDRLTARTIQGTGGITVDVDSDSTIIINSNSAEVVNDLSPSLGGPLDARGLGIAVPNLDEFWSTDEAGDIVNDLVENFNNTHGGEDITADALAINKGYADDHYLQITADGRAAGPLRVRDEPLSPDTTDPDYDSTLTGNYLSTEAIQRKYVVLRSGDTMDGKLYLNDHPSPMEGFGTPNGSNDLQAATKFYVDNSTYTSAVNLYVSTSGDDLQQKSPVGKEGRYWQYAYKTVGAAALQAENLISLASQEPGPYRQRITYTKGFDQYFSTIQGVTLTGGNVGNSGYEDASELLRLNRDFIQTETIAYINNKYVNVFTYDKTRCSRDVQLIIDSVANDLVLDSTFNTTRAATSYFNGTANKVTSSQLIQTIDAIKFARDEILNFSFDEAALEDYIGRVIDALCYDLIFQSNYQSIQVGLYFTAAGTKISTVQMVDVLNELRDRIVVIPAVAAVQLAVNSINNNIANINNIISFGTVPAVSMPVLSSTTTGKNSAKNLLLNNIAFLQAEAVAFLTAEHPTLTYNRTTCKRDVQYIVWSMVYDLIYGGNSQSVYAGLRYWDGANRNIFTTEVTPIIETLTYINQLVQSIITNTYLNVTYQQTVSQYVNETYPGATSGVEGVALANSIAIIKTIINDSEDAPTVVIPTVSAAPEVLRNVRTAILADKSTLETAMITYINNSFAVINNPTILTKITDLFQIVIDLLTLGLGARVAPSYGNPVGISSGFVNARRLLIANIDFIAAETTAYVASQHSAFWNSLSQAQKNSCSRDVKYFIEALAYDLNYGGNSGTTYAAQQYYQNSVLQIASGEVTVTLDAYTYAQNISVLIAQNITVDNPRSAIPQVINGSWSGGSAAVDKINQSFDTLKIIIDTNPSDIAITYPVLTGYDSDLQTARTIIVSNKSVVAANTIIFLDTNFSGGFNYNETICNRDVGLIIDGLRIDIMTDGTWQSIFAGKSYYRNASARAIAIGTQLKETLDAIAFMRGLVLQVLNQTTASRFQSQVTQVFDPTKTASASAKTDVTNGIDTIVNIIQYGLGAAPSPTFGTGIWNVEIDNGGNSAVDQGLTGNVDIIPAKVIVGLNSQSYASIVKYQPSSDTNTDTIQVRLTKPGFFNVGEQIEFGETVKDLHITIFVESGIYYEDYPIKLPENCSIKGDDFRRSIIRPRDRISQSPWRKVFFYRDAIIDALELGPYNFDTDYAPDSSVTINGTSGTITISLGTGQVPQSWIGLVVMDDYQATPGDFSKRGRAVIDSVSGNIMNCSVIYPFSATGTLTVGNWHLYKTINYGRFYLTDPLDITSPAKNNKEIDAFLCNDQTRINNMTFQGHGGFAMVLDPEGQIKTKSPYGQVCSSFSQSNNRKRFAGGQFVDGFAGRLYGTIIDIADNGITLTVQGETNSGLDIRPPQPPCAFFVQGNRYQINDVVSFNAATATVVLTLDVGTPYWPAGPALITPGNIKNPSSYNNTTCSRDVGLILNTVTDDLVTGSNYGAINAGRAYLRSDASTVLVNQLTATTSGINKARDLALETIPGSTYAAARSAITDRFDIINTIINQGLSSAPALTFPTAATSTSNAVKAKDNLQANRDFIRAEIVAWLSATYVIKNIPNYNAVKCSRDVGYMLDALCYDIMYQSTSATWDSLLAYYGRSALGETGSSQITGQETYFQAAFGRFKTVVQTILTNGTVSKSAGNNSSQTINAAYSISNGTTEYATIGSLCDLIVDYTFDGDDDAPTVARSTPVTTGLNATLVNARTTILGQKTNIQSNVITYLNDGGGLVINIEMGGNKSMLANDFAMINDLGYAIMCTNGGVSEQVSTFTYYCHTHYWANNGGQIRSVAGSNAHGTYGLRASGYDVTEKPDAVTLAEEMTQTARIYKQGQFAAEMTPTATKQALAVYIIGYEYIPYNITELEIDHFTNQEGITRYEVANVEHTVVTINGQNVLKLNINTAGNNGTSSVGLVTPLYDGQVVTLRNLQNIKFNNIDNVRPTRPSTALQYIDNLAEIYRIIAYNLTESTGELLGNNIAILQADSSFSYYKFSTDLTYITTIDPSASTIAVTGVTTNGTTATLSFASQGSAPYAVGQYIAVNGIDPDQYNGVYVVTACTATSVSYANTSVAAYVGGGKIGTQSQGAIPGDSKVAVLEVNVQSTIDQINKGIFVTGWAGRTHRVVSYTPPSKIATGTAVSWVAGTRTLTLSSVAGTIVPGQLISGSGIASVPTHTVESVTGPTLVGGTLQYTVVVNTATGITTPGGTITFGVFVNGYLTIDSNPIANVAGDGTSINALSYNSISALGTSLTQKAVTFDVTWSPSALPIVDANYYISGQANTKYNGWHQCIGAVSKTQLTVADTSNLNIGMFVACSDPKAFVPSGAIIQSIDGPNTFTVSPACWIPAGATVSSTIVSVVTGVNIIVAGSGYDPKNPPTLTFSGGDASVQAIATCSVNTNGEIDKVTVVSPGFGYTSLPTITLSYGNAVLVPVLSASAEFNTTASAGVITNQVTLAYKTNPGSFTAGASVIATGSSKTGSGPYSVTFTIPSTAVTQNSYYRVTGNSNPLYNGYYKCTTATGTVTSIVLEYPYDPGTYGTGTTTLTKEATSASSSSLGISKEFSLDSSTTLRLGYASGTAAQITQRISTCRATGHDFLDIGTGSYSTTNYPYTIYGNPAQSKNQANEVIENGVGRVFYVTTDQNGIFRVGRFFTVDQGTGTVTFSASIALSNLDGLGFKRGVVVSEFSTDSTMTNNAPEIVPVQSAIRGYIDKRLGLDHGGGPVPQSNLVGPGYLALNGTLSMKGNLVMGGFNITNLATPLSAADGATKKYVDDLRDYVNAELDAQNQLSELEDVNLTSPADGAFLIYDNATSKWIDVPVPTNVSANNDVQFIYTNGVLTTSINAGVIVNADVSASAAIAQSKLNMVVASTRANATGITQADRGLASFDSTNFTATDGWIGIKASSISKAQMTTIGADAILGNTGATATNPTEVSTGKIVEDGNGIKNASFTAASNPATPVGAMILVSTANKTTTSGVTNTGGSNTYAVLPITTTAANNSLVKTGAAGEIDAKTLKIASYKAIDLTSTTFNYFTPSGFNFATATGTTGSNTSFTTFGTLDTTNGTLKTDEITSGGTSTTGTITGDWQVLASSRLLINSNATLEIASGGTFKTTTITTNGTDTGTGTIQGYWSLTGASRLQATYADLAEYYEGDQEYEPGTVLVFGGGKEVTTTNLTNDTRSAGVVTTNPAYIMNAEQTGIKVCIALAGRVPCKVVGRVKKGDLLTTAAVPGFACKALSPTLGAVIGKALEDKDYSEAGVIQVAVGRV